MQTLLHKKLISPLFEAISSRAGQNLGSDVLALALIDPDKMACELYYRSANSVSDNSVSKIKNQIPTEWHKCKNDGFKIICEKRDDGGLQSRQCGHFMDVFKCDILIRIPFELEEFGGILFWGWCEKPDDFSDEYLEKAKMIAEQIKLSLNLSLKERQGEELAARMGALLELSTAIYSSLNYKDVLEKAIRLSMKIIGADGGSVLILDKKENIIRPLMTIDDAHEEEISKVTLKPGEGMTGQVIQTGVAKISNYDDEDSRIFHIPGTPDEPESLISAPLTWAGEVFGAITLRSSKGRVFDQADLDVLMIFARQTADAIQNAKLYESLDKAYKELTATQEQLVMTEKLRALGEMAGGVAHDFNNVLGTILGRTQLLLNKATDAKWIENLKQIETVTLSGAKTVEKLQNFTRVSHPGRFDSVDLVRVIEDSIETTRPKWKDECQRRGINISVEPDIKPLRVISGNKDELIEALSNVILNAVDALVEGGTIKISAYESESRAVIKVEDNGVGMADSTLNRLFFPFFTTKGMESTGMGLAVVYGIVNRHNGEINFSSKLGEGTTCTIYLPIAKDAKPETGAEIELTEEKKARILFVDDDENIRIVMKDMLEFMDHTVALAESGEEGVELFKTRDFDLVLTDLGMPGLSGWEVTRICKSLKPHVPVIMVSGWGNQVDAEQVAHSGLSAVISKPFEMNKIKIQIQQTLAERPDKSADTPTGAS